MNIEGRRELVAPLSRIGFGAAPLGGLYRATSDEDSRAALAEALTRGISYFDTAPMYGHGLSEHRVGEALRGIPRDDFVLSTKAGRLLTATRTPLSSDMFRTVLPFGIRYDYSYDGILRSVEDSLQRLGMSYIDIIYIHDISPRWHGPDLEARLREVIDHGYRALDRLKVEGLIGAIGVGVNNADILVRLAAVARFDVFMIAGSYTLMNQSAAHALLPLCQSLGIAVAVAAPFAGGLLVTNPEDRAHMHLAPDIVQRVARLEAVCHRHGIPLPAAALQFSGRHPAVATVVPGFRAPQEVRMAQAYSAIQIPTDFWHELQAEGLVLANA